MKDRLRDYLQEKLGEGVDMEDILKNFTVKTIKSGTVLLQEGAIANEAYFINRGAIRTYYFTEQGREKTRYVGFENALVTSVSSFISQQPSSEYVESLEDTEVCIIHRSDFYRLVKEIPSWARFYVSLLEYAYVFQNDKIASLTTVSAKQRFDDLIKENPIYFQRLSNRVLASYLDIREETLSRLKSK